MRDTISSVAQVVTAGPDWPAIAAGITAGVVGLAGIFGTLWQGKRSREAQTANLKESLDAATENLKLGIAAEDRRADHAEKRRIYASCLTAFVEMTAAVTNHRSEFSAADRDAETWEAARSRLARARDAMFDATSVMRLAAPEEVADLADKVRGSLMDYVKATREGATLGSGSGDTAQLRAELDRAMRADLGVPD